MTAVEALARAHRAVSHPNDPRCDHPDLHTNTARALLSNLSDADRLEIAGISEERLAEVLKEYDSGRIEVTVLPGNAVPVGGKPRRFHRAWAAALLAALATPGTPEGGEL